jgi:hypothetical protein
MEAEGTVQVIVRGGLIGGCLNHLLGLPREGHGVRVHLKMVSTPEGSLWERSFDGRPIVTRITASGDRLTEVAGDTAIDYELSLGEDRMEYRSTSVRVKGRELPKPMRPKVSAVLTPRGEGWYVAVRVSLPVFGLLCHYEGEMRPA